MKAFKSAVSIFCDRAGGAKIPYQGAKAVLVSFSDSAGYHHEMLFHTLAEFEEAFPEARITGTRCIDVFLKLVEPDCMEKFGVCYG